MMRILKFFFNRNRFKPLVRTPRARQEHLQFFVSALKTVCMRTSVEYLPYLMTEDRDLPVFRRAMTYTAYDEALVRTQARSAQLWFYPKLKQNQELLCIALDIARSEMLGLVICVWLCSVLIFD